MASFTITSPEGKSYTVNAPEGATKEQAFAMLQRHLSGQQDMPSMSTMENLTATAKDLPQYLGQAATGLIQGINDLPMGVAQLATKLPLVPDSANQAVNDYMKFREQKFAELRGDKADSPNIARATGNIITAIPFAAREAAPTLLGRMAQGAKTGAVVGALSPVNPDAENYWLNKGGQVGLGGVLGFASVPVVETLAKGVSSAVSALGSKFRGALSAMSAAPDQVESTLQSELQKNGVDWNSMSSSVRSSLIDEVQKALASGKPIDPQAISRLADFKSLNIDPTVGQLSRNPAQFAMERNLGKTELGAPLAQRFGEQNQGLLASLKGGPLDEYATGAAATKALQSADAAKKATVDGLYSAAREQAGVEAKVPMQPIAQRLGQLVEDFGDDKLPSAVAKRLNEYGINGGTQTKVFNLREAEKLRQLISNNLDPLNKPQAAFLTQLRGSIDDAVNMLADKGDEIGMATAQAFGKARSAAAERFTTLDNTPALKAAVNGEIQPEKFVTDYVIRGGTDDVKNLFGQLDPQASGAVRSQVIQYLKQKATGGAAEEVATFSQKSYNDALNRIGDRKLALIFPAEDIELLKRVGRVSSYVMNAPISSGVNHSGSATTLLDLLDKVSKVPVLGAVIGKPGDLYRSAQINSALNGVLSSAPNTNLPLLAPRAGILASPLAGAVPGMLSR